MTLIKKDKIGLITTVSNWDLYKKTRPYFPEGIKHFTIDGTQGFYGIKSIAFFLKSLRKYGLDWLIMADEDVIFNKPNHVFDLIAYLEANDFTVCGMRDGGTLHWRNKNPHMINHFFAVLNLREIYSIYNEKEMMSNQYINKTDFCDLSDDLRFKNYDPDSLFEPYYRFYLWLLRKGKKIKYLDAINPIKNDYATTLLYDHRGEELLYHTWYARFYGKDPDHTKRIDGVISNFKPYDESPSMSSPILLENAWYSFKYRLYKFSRKLKRKIS
ncbi:hypothetical protein [Salegentibacter flavus]|uniref:Glycosyl transferase family 2 n=1 Tax=Salegentibacter flavus TaxID=287099 RepID=A0A1I4Y6L5_9FLAO|nr:hypothetical protein [Salegentibacter flavus]SFN33169.1 hypothetical protein SAMN05660413_00531 [Salegentibacter flavus]